MGLMRWHRQLLYRSTLLCLLASAAAILVAPRPVMAAFKVRQIITADEANQHLQADAVVCGTVASTRYADTTPGKQTYINLGRPFPDQAFTAVIPVTLRPKYNVPPEQLYKGKKICVTGVITASRDKPQIIIADPSQITIGEPPTPTAPAPTDTAGN